jgi:thiosulfate reductase cytochrome b subunit
MSTSNFEYESLTLIEALTEYEFRIALILLLRWILAVVIAWGAFAMFVYFVYALAYLLYVVVYGSWRLFTFPCRMCCGRQKQE